ncbi:MAG: hypothetical protein SWK76_00245 [Actinomycetota bacterium]|nr:hypothetical protein [Actinomycetota bacterium]
MRKAMVTVLVAVLLIAVVGLIGCGESKVEVETPGEEAAVSGENEGVETPTEGEEGEGAETEGDETASEEAGADTPGDEGSDEGSGTADGNGDTHTHYEEGDTSIDISEEAPSEEDLGSPIYPGAAYVAESGGIMSGESGGDKFFTATATFTTGDSYQKVLDWYRAEIGEPTYEGTGGYEEASWIKGGMDDMISVEIGVEEGKVFIILSHIQGSFEGVIDT